MSLHPKAERTLQEWHRMADARDLSEVAALCAPDAVFRSPVAHTPYKGAPLVAQFLQQALQAFEDFRYHRTFYAGDHSAVLEFSAKVGGKELEGHRHDPLRRGRPHDRVRGDGAPGERPAGAGRGNDAPHDADPGGGEAGVRLLTLPLTGRVARSAGGVTRMGIALLRTPTPNPSPQGGGESVGV